MCVLPASRESVLFFSSSSSTTKIKRVGNENKSRNDVNIIYCRPYHKRKRFILDFSFTNYFHILNLSLGERKYTIVDLFCLLLSYLPCFSESALFFVVPAALPWFSAEEIQNISVNQWGNPMLYILSFYCLALLRQLQIKVPNNFLFILTGD